MVSTKNATLRVAKALGIGEATVKRIMAAKKKPKESLESKKRGKPPYKVSSLLAPIIRDFIRQKNLKGKKVSTEELRKYLLLSHQTDIPSTTLLRTLKRLGFVFGIGERRNALKEQEYVINARRNYLRQKIANRSTNGSTKRPEVYLDETYVNKNHSRKFTWYLEEDGPDVNKPSGKGPRLIILNAITKDGWVNGTELVFVASKRTGDYHGQMNGDNFSMWFKNQLLPNIPSNSLIMLDNAKYHNVLTEDTFPKPTTTKEELRAWLEKNYFSPNNNMLKSELFEKCKELAPKPKRKLDEIAEAHGHTIVRTPQYHPELQPIETCWAIVKNERADNCDFTMENLKKMLPKAFEKVTPKTCQKLIAKMVKQEDKFWKEDKEIDDKK